MSTPQPDSVEESPDRLISAARWLIVVTGIGLLAAVFRSADDPAVPLLWDFGSGQWVTADRDVHLGANFNPVSRCAFRRTFYVETPQPAGSLDLRALRCADILLDELHLSSTTGNDTHWKEPSVVSLPALNAGDHTLIVEVTNQNGPAALWIDSSIAQLRTSANWEASTDAGASWQPVRRVCETRGAAISDAFVKNPAAALRTLPWLLPVFIVVYIVAIRKRPPDESSVPSGFRFEPRHLKNLLLTCVLLLSIHNLGALQPHVGYDILGHLDYSRFIAERGELPLATDGWQMFQSPLYYLINAPLYGLLADHMDLESIAKLLRFLPMLCGLIQIELVYRTSRLVFPEQSGLQCVSLVVGGMFPMAISVSQTVGNEPLAACLTSWTLLRFLRLLSSSEIKYRDAAILGLVWGLALLTKVTPILLGPVLVTGIVVRCLQTGVTLRRALSLFVLLSLAAFAVSGWYYVRNWILLGAPFVGGWDPSRGIVWWQEPGYRTASHFINFGAALVQPIYSGVHGLWDGLYSTIYADGFLSGILDARLAPSWNMPFLVAGAWWGLLPTALIGLGLFRGVGFPRRLAAPRPGLVVMAAACVLVFLAAVVLMYFRVPIYGAAKGSYLLGLLPCFGLLAAAGAEPVLRSKRGAAVLAGLLACWCAVTLIAFFA